MHIAGAFLLQGNKLLLGKRAASRKYYPNVWDMVGGHGEGNETPLQTLTRELAEEIGVIPTKSILLAVQDNLQPELYGDRQHYVYLVTAWEGTPSNLLPEEHDDLAWFTIDEAMQLDLAYPGCRELFQQIAASLL